jgi:Protein-glutamine gamma-glutamyltransferase
MRRFTLLAVLACFLVGSDLRADGNAVGNLLIDGVPLQETPEEYLRAIRHLTVAPKDHKHPAFLGTNIQAIRAIESPLRRQIFNAMVRNRSDRFEFATLTKAQENFTMRVAAVHFMVRMGMRVSDGGLDFNYHRPGQVAGEADRQHWRKLGTFVFETPPGVSASDAIDGICRAKFRGECLGAIEITILQAARKAIGDDRFNALHSRGLKVGDETSKMNTRHFRSAAKVSVADMVPGDWVYMKNQDDYNKGLRRGVTPGPWQGENAIYMGRYDVDANRVPVYRTDAAPRFSGMGAYNKDEAGLRQSLKEGYTKLMRPPYTSTTHPISERNIRWTSVRRLVTGE